MDFDSKDMNFAGDGFTSGNQADSRVPWDENEGANDSFNSGSYESGSHAEKPKKKRKIVLWILVAVFVILGGFVTYATVLSPEAHGIWTLAVFGVDSRDGNVDKGLADVNMVCQINMDTGEMKLVSVYRDTYMQIREDDYYHKLNAAYSKGGAEQAVWTLQNNLDLKIDDYATFNWKAVVDGINILGGVDIEITDAEFKYINGFITETVNSTGVGSTQLTAPGMQHLDGVQAVAYARLRLMDTDFKRTERQRAVVSQCFEKAKQADLTTLKTLAEAILPQISTTVTLERLIPLAAKKDILNLGETTGWPFDKVCQDIKSRGNCVIPVTLESNVVKLHECLYPGQQYTPSEFVVKASKHIAELTGQYGN